MKLFISFFALFCCLNFADGLKCVVSGPNIGTSNSDCLIIDEYCYTATYKEKITTSQRQITIQGCSGKTDSIGIGIGVCKKNGEHSFDNDLASGSLYCCDKDLCNSATTFSFLGIGVIIVIAKFLFL